MAILATAESYTTSAKRDQIIKGLRDPEYRRALADDIGTGIAFQIRLLREDRGWTQGELAERMAKRQETISQWENPNYGRYTLSTLKDLAAAFDVAPIVRFAPFSELVEWTISLSPERLAPPSFDAEFGSTATMAISTDIAPVSASDVSALMDQIAQNLVASGDAFQTAVEIVEEVESAIRKASPVENHYAKAA